MLKFRGNNKVTVIKPSFGDHKPFTFASWVRDLVGPKAPTTKSPVSDPDKPIAPTNIEINHIAVILDGVVQDVVRTQNKFAALLLSEPQFVSFKPEDGYPVLGETTYVDGVLNLKARDAEED